MINYQGSSGTDKKQQHCERSAKEDNDNDSDDLVEVNDNGMDNEEEGGAAINGDDNEDGTPDNNCDVEERNDVEDAHTTKNGACSEGAAFV